MVRACPLEIVDHLQLENRLGKGVEFHEEGQVYQMSKRFGS